MAKKSPEELIREMKVEAGGGGRVGDGPPAGVTPKEPLFQAKDHATFADEQERLLADGAPRRAKAQKRLESAKRRAPAIRRRQVDAPEYMPGDSELGGDSVAAPSVRPEESLQDARFAAEQSARASRGRSEYFMDSMAGMLPTAAVVGGMVPEGLPGSRPTEALRNPTWRSDAGRAGAAMRDAGNASRNYDKIIQAGPEWARKHALGNVDRSPRYGFQDSVYRHAANTRAIAREAAKKVVPMATAGAAAYAAPALTAGLVAAPLFAAPLNFVFGEGEGSYAQTQDFKSQVDTLARHKGGPLDVRDLEPVFFERLAGEPGIAEALIQSGTLSDESIEELGYWQGRAREREEAEELARRRSLGMEDAD